MDINSLVEIELQEREDIFNGYGVEIELQEREDFLKVKETLTRIGVSSRDKNELFQSCHILHKRGRYRIVHFKEMFMLDGKPSNFTEEDKARRNTIANLLHEWELIDIVDLNVTDDPVLSINKVKIISHKDKKNWRLVPKYNIGK